MMMTQAGNPRGPWLALVGLCLLMMLTPGRSWAALTVDAVTLDGASSVTVAPGATITAQVTVTTTGGTDWRSTAWRVSTTAPGTTTCVNTPNNDNNGTYSETFSIAAPTAAGTYNAYFIARANNTCGSTASSVFNLDNSVIVEPPRVLSIDRVDANPTSAASVAWTVTFNGNVSGVNAADFVLAQAGGVSGTGISSVTGSGATYTVTAYTGLGAGTLGLNLADDDSIQDSYGNRLGGSGAGNGDFTGQAYDVTDDCLPPANVPPGLAVSCVCDRFSRTALNPSSIFGASWVVSIGASDTSGLLPSIATPGFLRLTGNTANNAKAATVPGIFPAAGNYISVEFQHYAYNGSGADGIAVTLSDYSVPAVPGAYGGSLGYAQRSGVVGFAGGWVGVALDESGNYQNPTEGRIGGPGFIVQSVGVRGSGSGMNGYRWLAGTPALTPQIDNRTSTTPSRGHTYQVIVDARNEPTSTAVQVNRDTGGGYQNLINLPNVYAAAIAQGTTQAPVPANWQISFTGSTGGSTNIHEIGALKICAQTVVPPTGGTASGFSAIDEAYPTAANSVPAYQNFQTGNIFMKVVNAPFRLWVGALTNTGISSAYSLTSNKSVTVKLVDNADNVCGPDSARTCNSACTGKPAVAGGSQTLTFTNSDPGAKLSNPFTLNSAHRNLLAIVSDGLTTACAVDSFSVRPAAMSAVSSSAGNAATSGEPKFRAGADPFTLAVTTAGVAGQPNGYNGTPKINNAALVPVLPATVAGIVAPTIFPASVSATPNSVATGNAFTYSEVGAFVLRGYGPASDAVSPRGIYDDTWTALDSASTENDCNAGSYSNTKDANGKYGCNFGLVADTAAFGRFYPYEFALTNISLVNRPIACAPFSPPWPAYSYLDEAMNLTFTLEARAGGGNVTRNYVGALAKLDLSASNAALDFAAAQAAGALPSPLPLPYSAASLPFVALSPRLSASGFTGNWISAAPVAPNPDQRGTIGLNGTVAISSLNTPADNRVGPPDGPYLRANIAVAPIDGDGVRITAYDLDRDNSGSLDSATLGTTALAFGMIRLNPGISSERLPLTMTAELLVHNGTGFVPNNFDTCTRLPMTQLGLSNWTGNLVNGDTAVVVSRGSTTPVGAGDWLRFVHPVSGNPVGLASFWLRPPPVPNHNGSVRVTADLVAAGLAYLQGRQGGAAKYNVNPAATATFGLYKGAAEIIHMRENF